MAKQILKIVVWEGPKSLLAGLRVTWRHLWRKKVTLQYPDAYPEVAPRFRGLHGLTKDPETGDLNCIGCLSCARICPDGLITIETEKREGHRGRYPVNFTINLGPCCFCGLCSEVCPTPMKSLILSSEFEWAAYQRDGRNLVLTKEDLIAIGEREVARRSPRRGQPEEEGNPYFQFAPAKKKRERVQKGGKA
ncbi:MAG TPA: NADH-quinone oxidoreductase subunit I [Armatimonadetes bacterium]|nr:NADH-quinone oxidoreductase subunit I [Armatimonadota bacterium]